MKRTAFAPGKIILSGEYAVVFGKKGIAIPTKEGITVTYEENSSPLFGTSNLPETTKSYLQNIIEELDLKTGLLSIENTLPVGKGMGSSTSLIIAVCKAVLGDDCRAKALKIEDKLNPGHSGIDFAVIWENAPLIFQKGSEAKRIDLTLPPFELMDTGLPNEQTPELVAWVKDRFEKNEDTVQAVVWSIGRCSERILAGEDIKTVIREHHKMQVLLGVVPIPVQKKIEEIEAQGGSAKVIGAGGRTGGGGMVLVIR